jgi:predicted SAM-dependent methyltransferase
MAYVVAHARKRRSKVHIKLQSCMQSKFLNLACGDFYVKNNHWVNLDWYPHSEYVEKANLIEKLKFPDETFEVVYTSHFVEHIPKEKLDFILSECYRVLKPRGILRIVVPDFENIVREYLRNLENNEFEKAEFNTIELLDQCVRSKSGGTLSAWRGRAELNEDFRNYISRRTGYIYKKHSSEDIKTRRQRSRIPRVTRTKLQWLYCKFLTRLMPEWFVQNHVNFTNTGELHKWVYDEMSLSKHLFGVRFSQVIRVSASESQIANFPHVPLDIDENGNIRKGAESMFLEAVK